MANRGHLWSIIRRRTRDESHFSVQQRLQTSLAVIEATSWREKIKKRRTQAHVYLLIYFFRGADLLSRLTDFIRMQIRGPMLVLAQYPHTMATSGLVFADCAARHLVWKKLAPEKRPQTVISIPMPVCAHAREEIRIPWSQKAPRQAADYFARGQHYLLSAFRSARYRNA